MAKCQLCGGKIRNGRCSLCGWINQDKKEYLLNKSSCDGKPSSNQAKSVKYDSAKAVRTPKTSYKPKPAKKKKFPLFVRAILIIVGISIFSDLLSVVIRWIQEIVYLFV